MSLQIVLIMDTKIQELIEKYKELLQSNGGLQGCDELYKWELISKHKKLSPETLDRIALFAGFQSWKDFSEALHGEDDGQANYDVEGK